MSNVSTVDNCAYTATTGVINVKSTEINGVATQAVDADYGISVAFPKFTWEKNNVEVFNEYSTQH